MARINFVMKWPRADLAPVSHFASQMAKRNISKHCVQQKPFFFWKFGIGLTNKQYSNQLHLRTMTGI